MRVITRAEAVTAANRETAKELPQQKRQQGSDSGGFEAVFEQACKKLEKSKGGKTIE